MPDTQSAIGPLRTPPVVQGSVIALRTAGKSKRSIARELGIDRKTVDNVLEVYQADQPNYSETIHKLATSAFVRVSEAIDKDKDTDTARWALEHTAFRSATNEPLAHRDQSLNIAVGFVPSTPSTSSQPSLPSSTSPATEAAEIAGSRSISLASHENFSQFSLAELEAEVARRKAQLIEVETTDVAR